MPQDDFGRVVLVQVFDPARGDPHPVDGRFALIVAADDFEQTATHGIAGGLGERPGAQGEQARIAARDGRQPGLSGRWVDDR